MVELVWEYSSQMEARQLTNAFEYVARCRHWKQFQFERQQAIQSLPSSTSGQTEAHLPVLATGSSQQQQQPPCPPSNELVSLSSSDPRESSNTGPNLSSMQITTSSGVGAQACPQSRAQETDLARPSRQYRTESFTPQTQIASQLQHSQPNSQAYQTPAREPVSHPERAFVSQSSASTLGLPPVSQPAGVPQTLAQGQNTGASDSSDVLCRVCYDKPFNVVLVPCGHFAVCSSCAERCKDCPICRRPIRGTVRINYSN